MAKQQFPAKLMLACFLVWCTMVGQRSLTIADQHVPRKANREVIVAVGAAGDDQFQPKFESWAGRWRAAAAAADISATIIGLDDSSEANDRKRFQSAVQSAVESEPDELWIVLIGHGTFDGRLAKFNLRGPDVAAGELAEWLLPRSGVTVVINTASSSAPFIARLAGPNRIVMTATKSGHQYNFARFGDYLSQAIQDATVDLDKDQQTSLLEAFLAASHATQDFYTSQGRLATEHALLDDNGDGKGTGSDWFTGIRPNAETSDGAETDGFRASQLVLVRRGDEARLTADQLEQRNQREWELEQLRQRKSDFTEDEYYRQLEKICIAMARLYESVPAAPNSDE